MVLKEDPWVPQWGAYASWLTPGKKHAYLNPLFIPRLTLPDIMMLLLLNILSKEGLGDQRRT